MRRSWVASGVDATGDDLGQDAEKAWNAPGLPLRGVPIDGEARRRHGGTRRRWRRAPPGRRNPAIQRKLRPSRIPSSSRPPPPRGELPPLREATRTVYRQARTLCWASVAIVCRHMRRIKERRVDLSSPTTTCLCISVCRVALLCCLWGVGQGRKFSERRGRTGLLLMYQTEQTGKPRTTTAQMHVTACLAGQKVEVEVGEECRTIQALQEAIVEALPQLCIEGFDVSVGGRALDDDEGVVSLSEDVSLDVSANSRGLSLLALREAGREVSEAGLLEAAVGDVALVTLYLDAGVPIDCVDDEGQTPLHKSCYSGHLEITTLLLDRGSTAIDEDGCGWTPLHYACDAGNLELATLLLDRGSTAIDEKDGDGWTPLHVACHYGHLGLATLLLDRGSTAIDEKTRSGYTPLHSACRREHLELARLLLDRGCSFDVAEYRTGKPYSHKVLELLSERGHDVLPDASPEKAKRRRIGEP